MNPDLRLYTFVNFYLSSIQQGIQSAHVAHSLFVKYPSHHENSILWDWAINAKTMIVLNGGALEDITRGFQLVNEANLNHKGTALPFECFFEDSPSLGGIMTSFGIVLPPQIYDAKKWSVINGGMTGMNGGMAGINENSDSYFYFEETLGPPCREFSNGTPEYAFIKMLKSCGLAR